MPLQFKLVRRTLKFIFMDRDRYHLHRAPEGFGGVTVTSSVFLERSSHSTFKIQWQRKPKGFKFSCLAYSCTSGSSQKCLQLLCGL